ncbi:hypothetical protein GUJ93_ZPchr0010g10103 [Zizania palustris]|uniref:Uncharacterized protein n=1 Tax=Zizania palustris TaxID=103762 RepID=A0A8J5WBL8_ZIZPA|nr:hypothetical protein GUJ93_ZPchr0010g10103 [Zizania palustris]
MPRLRYRRCASAHVHLTGRRGAARLASAASPNPPSRLRPSELRRSGLPPPASTRLPPSRGPRRLPPHARNNRWRRGGDSSELGRPSRPRAPALPPRRPANPAGGRPLQLPGLPLVMTCNYRLHIRYDDAAVSTSHGASSWEAPPRLVEL